MVFGMLDCALQGAGEGLMLTSMQAYKTAGLPPLSHADCLPSEALFSVLGMTARWRLQEARKCCAAASHAIIEGARDAFQASSIFETACYLAK